MGVSPRGNSDNVFVRCSSRPGVQIRGEDPGTDRQGPGLFWYHPHFMASSRSRCSAACPAGSLLTVSKIFSHSERPARNGSFHQTCRTCRIARSFPLTDRSIRPWRSGRAKSNFGVLPISVPRCSSNSASRGCPSTWSRRMVTLCLVPSRMTEFFVGPVKGSMQS